MCKKVYRSNRTISTENEGTFAPFSVCLIRKKERREREKKMVIQIVTKRMSIDPRLPYANWQLISRPDPF